MNLHHELITPNLRTTSRVVAEKFGKNHKDVLKRIENQMHLLPAEFNERNFAPVEYLDAKGEARAAYEMTRDGFTIIVMGMTGAAAMEWKVRFIQAFNMMEAELAGRAPAADDPELPADIAALSVTDKASICREIRLMAGARAALDKWNWMMPAALRVPSQEPAVPTFTIDDGRACLRHILAFQTGHGTVAQVFAGSNGPAGDAVKLLGLGLRWNSHLFVARETDPRLFDATPWAGGWHPDALLTIPGANTVPDRRKPGVLVPLAGITGAVIPLHPED